MTTLRIKIFAELIAIFLIVLGCKSTEKTTPDKETALKYSQPIPESFSTEKDTVNMATIRWDVFYKDPNLKKIIEITLTNNYDLLIAMQKIEAVSSGIRLNKGSSRPNLSIGGAVSQRKFGQYTMDGAGNASTEIKPGEIVPEHLPDFVVGFNASWEIDVWGKMRNKKKAALARYSNSIEGKNAIQTALISEVATTYFELLALDRELEIVRETIELQLEALEIIKIKKEAGVLNELAVKQFEGQVLNSKALEYQILQKITINENKLNYLTGQFPKTIQRDNTQFNKSITTLIHAGIPSQLLQNRSDIRRAEMDLVSSQCDLKSAKAAFYPSFTINATAGFQAFQTSLWFQSPESFAYSILGGLAMPLLNRSAIKAHFQTAKANQTEALLNYQKTILNSYIEVSNELSNINNLEKLYELKNEEVDTYNLSISIANDLFKSGRATYLEVLTAQRTALQSKIELIAAKKLQHHATINLYRALGGGW